jgi:methylenetetrahydrofolate dehydrogenase (NADP+) / methenyltetrahydrofolate cyclohydrolase
VSAKLIDGRSIQQEILERVARSLQHSLVVPTVALVMVEGDDPMAGVNFRLHQKVLGRAGLLVKPIVLPAGTTRSGLLERIGQLNADIDVDAVMALMPLPAHLDIREVLAAIDPGKEVEGLHPVHAGRLSPLSARPPARVPIVPLSVLTLLAAAGFNPSEAHVVTLVDPQLMESNPVAKYVARVGAFANLPPGAIGSVVPYTHPRAKEVCRSADLLIVSVTKPSLVTADWVKGGATVIDFNAICVGTEPHVQLVGGVDLESVSAVAGAISPIPGGIGPVMLGVLAEQIAQVAGERAAAREPAFQ